MNIPLPVKKAAILVDFTNDSIHLTLDMPSTYPQIGYEPIMKIDLAAGHGLQWCQDNLGIKNPEIISRIHGVMTVEEYLKERKTPLKG